MPELEQLVCFPKELSQLWHSLHGCSNCGNLRANSSGNFATRAPPVQSCSGKNVEVCHFSEKTERVKSSLTVQKRSKRKNSNKSGLQCGVHSAACEDRGHRQTGARSWQLQHSHLQARKELKEHSWGRSMLVGNEASFSASYFKTWNQEFSERRGKNDNWVCRTSEEKLAARCQLLLPFPTHFKCTTSSTNTEQTATGTATEHTSSEPKKHGDPWGKKAGSEQKAKSIHPSSQFFYRSRISFC